LLYSGTVGPQKRKKAQYTGENAGAGNSSLPNLFPIPHLITTQFIRRKR
jgi:hypothetical protein